MKRFTLLAISLLVIFTACKKDQPAVQQKGIAGTWNGSCSTGSETPVVALKFQMNENGGLSVLSKDDEVTAEGKWSLEGTQFFATYQDVPMRMITYSVAGYYDAINGKISGTYISTHLPQTTLNFAITRQ